MKKRAGFVAITVVSMFLIACGGSNVDNKNKTPLPAISISQSKVTAYVGEQKTIPVTAQNTDFSVSISPSSGSGCVKSGVNAIVCTPAATGVYIVTVTAMADATKKVSATVTVVESYLPPADAYTGDMVLVSGGTFIMGCTTPEQMNCSANEFPTHQVTLTRDYYIGKYEVTQAQWKAVMGADNNPSYRKGDDLPVEMVSWDEAQAFISRLNELTGGNYRLPTEAEWEFAARGGNQSMGYMYSGSNNVDEVAWYTVTRTNSVGTKAANELGIHDMSGNVGEWINCWYGSYSTDAQIDPQGYNSSPTAHTIRGGHFYNEAQFVRVSSRSAAYIDISSQRRMSVGFRIAHSR